MLLQLYAVCYEDLPYYCVKMLLFQWYGAAYILLFLHSERWNKMADSLSALAGDCSDDIMVTVMSSADSPIRSTQISTVSSSSSTVLSPSTILTDSAAREMMINGYIKYERVYIHAVELPNAIILCGHLQRKCPDGILISGVKWAPSY